MTIEFINVCFKIKGTTIVEDISFKINEAEIITIIGPNGGGKTTIAKLLMGMLKPTSGTIVKSKDASIAYMPQKMEINPFLPITVKEFIGQNALNDLSDKKLISLSGGEWQKVLLERCLLRKPNLLILDEPVQGVDVNAQKEIYKKLEDLRNFSRTAIVMISHDLNFVFKSSDVVLCVNKHICCAGHPVEITKTDEYKQFGFYEHHHDECVHQ